MNQKQSVQDEIDSVLKEFLNRVRTVASERIHVSNGCNRFLAEPILAFRPSPPVDTSAMDGYALRLSDVTGGDIAVSGTVAAGMQPASITPGQATKIFTGAAFPYGGDLVVRREDCEEFPSPQETHTIRIRLPREQLQLGQNIRRQGENAVEGTEILPAKSLLGPQSIAGVATFHELETVEVYKRLRVAVINTGDEILPVGVPIQPWQIRDSNGPFLMASLLRTGWAEPHVLRVPDCRKKIEDAIAEAIENFDTVLLTGGVSMGDSDHVPDAIRRTGAEVLFHKLPIRPGKPILGAVSHDGKPILGLPGNPVSVAVTFRRFAYPILKQAAGGLDSLDAIRTSIPESDHKTLSLLWFRLVMQDRLGRLMIESSKGSGDIASLAKSIGFIEVPPGEPSHGERLFYPWF